MASLENDGSSWPSFFVPQFQQTSKVASTGSPHFGHFHMIE